MIRKQLYIEPRQVALLKKRARAEGVSEAELVRRALDAHLSQVATRPDPAAWEREKAFLTGRREAGRGGRRNWRREDLYDR
ncbi:MAG: CopG family transcriptional regulator [Bacillota bacterium]|jgi:hypothetical protein